VLEFVAAGFVVVDEFVVDVPLLFVVVVEFVVDVDTLVFVAAGVGVAFATLVFVLLVALLAGAASPQAIPKALRAKTDESAITFFITNSSLLSSSKNKSNLFLPYTPRVSASCPKLKVFWKQTSL
jgi:hypothetical protein